MMSSSSRSARALRLWPAGLILAVAAAVLVAVWVPADSPVAMSQPTITVIAAIVTTLLLLLWWVFLSRARLWARLLVPAVVALLVGFASRHVEYRGLTGNLVPQLAWRDAATPFPLPPASGTADATSALPPTQDSAVARIAGQEATDASAPGAGEAALSSVSPGSRGSADSSADRTQEPVATTAGAGPEVDDAPARKAAAEPPPARVPEFPQFLGPNRNATLTGIHLARGWADRPPAEQWRHPIGFGWAGFAVGGGLAVTQEQRGDRAIVVAYDLATGSPRWSQEAGTGFHSPMAGDGPRATPTLHDGRVYAFGVDGVLRVLDLASGRPLFERDVLGENGGRAPMHGVSASPLLVDDMVVVVAGGGSGHSLVAYDAETGEPRWAGGDGGAAYSSPLVATLAGRRQIVVFNLDGLAGHDPRTGEVLWKDPWPDRPEKVAQPVILGDDRIFAAMGYGIGGRLVQIARGERGGFEARVLWETRRLKAKFTQVVEHGGFLYGLDDGVLVCLDAGDGERRWKRGRYGHGQVLLVDDLLLVQTEDGELVLVDPKPDDLVEIDRFAVVDGKTWATPALAGDLLIVRSEIEAACYRLPTRPGPAASVPARHRVAGGA